MSFPDHISIPVVTAASLAFSPVLTARDQSLLTLVAWYAAGHGLDEHGNVDVPDLDMRNALGGLKTIAGDREVGYYARLGAAAIKTDERLPDLADGVPVPTVLSGMRRVTVNRAKRWQIDEAIVAAFRLQEGEPVIEVPMSLLARARSRFTLPLFMRASAWVAGDVWPHWILRKRAKATEFKLSLDDLRETLGADGKAADLERHCLAPATAEIDAFTDMAFEYAMIAKPCLIGGGRARAVRIMVGGTERAIYSPMRRPKVFSEIGTKAPSNPPGRVIPFTVPYARATRRVLPKAEEDVPF
ncbi:MAG: hypothetical protein ACOH2M_01330 [Cypionkella sp.]